MDDVSLDLLRLASQGYCCVQMPLLLVLESHGREQPGLMRTLSALCHGFPDTAGPCGALVGGACLLGYFAGKGRAASEPDERLPLMLDQLQFWFTSHCRTLGKGINCCDLVSGGQPEPVLCSGLIVATHAQVLSLLMDNGFDPLQAPDDAP